MYESGIAVIAFLLVGSIMLFTGCKTDDDIKPAAPQPVVNSVAVAAAGGATTVQAGGTLQFNATVDAANGATNGVNWSVNPAVTGASINASGVLTVDAAVAVSTSITVRAASRQTGFSNVAGTATVTVAPVTPEVVSVAITRDGNAIAPGTVISVQKNASITFGANVTVLGGAPQTVSWAITSAGHQAGTTNTGGTLQIDADETDDREITFTVTSTEDASKSAFVIVKVLPAGAPAVTGVVINTAGNATSVAQGATLVFDAVLTTVNGAANTVTWSFDGSYATGTSLSVTAASTSTTLTVAANENADTIIVRATPTQTGFAGMAQTRSVTVNKLPIVHSVSITTAVTMVQAGGQQQFNATANAANGATAAVTWSITPAVAGASINSSGLLTVEASVTEGTSITVRAASAQAGFESVADTKTVTVSTAPPPGNPITIEPNGDVTIDWSTGNNTGATSYHVYYGRSRLELERGGAFLYVGPNLNYRHTSADAPGPNANKYRNWYRVELWNASSKIAERIIALEYEIFGETVYLFDAGETGAVIDSGTNIRTKLNTVHDTITDGRVLQSGLGGGGNDGEFTNYRHAFLFKPGTYAMGSNAETRIGFYTHVGGLGLLPTQTSLNGITIFTPTHLDDPPNNATCTFWRSIENFRIGSLGGNRLRWAVSQSAPMRRLDVAAGVNTVLDMNGQCSGGYTADSVFGGTIGSDPQQQWYFRNNTFNGGSSSALQPFGINWNKVVQGCNGNVIPTNTTTGRATNIPNTPLMREKPFLFLDTDGEYKVFKPALRTNAVGPAWSTTSPGDGDTINFLDNFYVVKPNSPTGAPNAYSTSAHGTTKAAEINAQLALGKHIFMAPGRYFLEAPIVVKNANTIILGYGFPTLMPAPGNTAGCLFIDDVPGVTVAGLMFDAYHDSTYLLTVGPTGSSANHAANPTVLYDICLRIGGHFNENVHTDICALVNSNHVIGDKFWVWRADHGRGAAGFIDWHTNTSKNGVVVMGDDVIFYGLFVEHFHEYNTLWMGDRGRMYFYQNETPYDVHYQRQYRARLGVAGVEGVGATDGWAMYKVDNRVNNHTAIGLGMYSVFLTRSNGVKESIVLRNAIEVPHKAGVRIQNATITRLGNHPSSGIHSIVNGTGGPSITGFNDRSLLSFENGTAVLPTGTIGGTNGVNGIAPANETHWVEALDINNNGQVINRSTGGRQNLQLVLFP